MKNIEYKEESLMDNLQDLQSKGFLAAPVVEYKGTYITGTNISGVAELLSKA